MVKIVFDSKHVAVPGEVVPLINIDAVSLVSYNLQSRKHYPQFETDTTSILLPNDQILKCYELT